MERSVMSAQYNRQRSFSGVDDCMQSVLTSTTVCDW